MREFSFVIDDALKLGLRRDERQARNGPGVIEMTNLKPSEFGAVSPETVTYPITSPALSMDWPFPVLIRGERVTLLAAETALYTVDESDWSTSPITTYDAGTPANTKAISAGTPWRWATFLDMWFMTNGASMVFKTPSNDSDKTLTVTTPTVQALCNQRNRLVVGGLAGAWFSGSRWAIVLDTWRDINKQHVLTHEDLSLGTSWVVWGSRLGGASDLPFHLLMAALGLFGNAVFDQVKGPIRQAVEDGEIGMVPVRHPGGIRAVEPLGASIVVYGENGVSRLVPDEHTYREEPVLRVGIAGRAAVGGDEDEHIFVDTQGWLWQYHANETAPHRLGYKEYLSGLTAADIVISKDESEGDYWIADGTTGYVFTEMGLGGPVDVQPTNLVWSEAQGLIGAADGLSDGATARVVTDQIDIAERGTKHVTELQVAASGMTSMRSQIDYRYSTADTFARSTVRRLNRQGVSFPNVSFVDGRIVVSGSLGETKDARIQRIEVRYTAEDRRYRRGTKGIPKER